MTGNEVSANQFRELVVVSNKLSGDHFSDHPFCGLDVMGPNVARSIVGRPIVMGPIISVSVVMRPFVMARIITESEKRKNILASGRTGSPAELWRRNRRLKRKLRKKASLHYSLAHAPAGFTDP